MSEENILDRIVAYKKDEVELQKKNLPINIIKEGLESVSPPLSIEKKFQEAIVRGKIALIGEVKKASPSKGLIRKDFNPVDIAILYQESGASAISVLTDEHFFQGSLDYLRDVTSVVNIPVLRKDFIIDPYQIYQSRYYGADLILLISSILSKLQILEYQEIASSLGMSSLIETHSQEDFDYFLEKEIRFIGINNRDLNTFDTDINHTLMLVKNKHLCKSFIISESGINCFEHIAKLSNAGISGVLIGEYFMRQDNISLSINKMFKGSQS
ncbi:MAG: indole-3-glycerol phosphate synthase TrpC [Cyanobacteriota bacterium]